MKGIFYSKTKAIKATFSLIIGAIVVAFSVYCFMNIEKTTDYFFASVLTLAGIAVFAVGIYSFIRIKKQFFTADDSGIDFGKGEIAYTDISSVSYSKMSVNEGTLSILLNDDRFFAISSLTNSDELCAYIRRYCGVREISDIDETEKQIADADKRSTLLTAFMIALFIVMIALLVILLVILYRNSDGGADSKRIVLLCADEFLVALALAYTTKLSQKALAKSSGLRMALRKQVLTTAEIGYNYEKLYVDRDYNLRLVVCHGEEGYYCIAEMITEDKSIAELDRSDVFADLHDLLKAIGADELIEIK